MFITDNLENNRKQSEESNDQERQSPFLLHHFLHLCSHKLLHSTFYIFGNPGVCTQIVGGSWNSVS